MLVLGNQRARQPVQPERFQQRRAGADHLKVADTTSEREIRGNSYAYR